MNDHPPNATSRLSSQLRLAGIIVLVIGLTGAGLVYWLGTRNADLSGDPSMQQFNKPTEHQMQILYGKQGRLIEDISNSLQQPGTQAVLIIAVTSIIAAACFRIATVRNIKP